MHLVGLGEIAAPVKRPAVAELGVGDLQLRLFPPDGQPVLAPVELEGLARREGERHIGAAPLPKRIKTGLCLSNKEQSR